MSLYLLSYYFASAWWDWEDKRLESKKVRHQKQEKEQLMHQRQARLEARQAVQKNGTSEQKGLQHKRMSVCVQGRSEKCHR